MDDINHNKVLKMPAIGKSIFLYLGSAWVCVEAINFLIDKYYLDTRILDIIIIAVIFGLPATIIYELWNRKFTKLSITLHTINLLIAAVAIIYFSVNPAFLNLRQLRIIHFKSEKQELAESIRTLAVLPFKNYTDNHEEQLLVSGLHGALINELGRMAEINIISKSSMDMYKGQDLTRFANEIGADGLIEISILGIGAKYELDLSLISALPQQTIIWSDHISIPQEELQIIFRTIISDLAKRIKFALSPNFQLSVDKEKLTDTEAYKAYLKGEFLTMEHPTEENLDRGLEYFKRSIQLDSTFAPGYAGISMVWAARYQLGMASGSAALPNIIRNNNKAMELDPDHPGSNYFKAVFLMQSWDWESSEKAYLKTLDLHPNHAFAHAHYSHLLMYQNRYDEAELHIEKALKLDPLHPHVTGLCAIVYWSMGEFDKAYAITQTGPNVFGKEVIEESIAFYNKDYDTSIEVLSLEFNFLKNSDLINRFKSEYETNGYTAAIGFLAEELDINYPLVPAMKLAKLYVRAGLLDDAIRVLQKGYENHDPNLQYAFGYPYEFDTLYYDPRFKEIADNMGLPYD